MKIKPIVHIKQNPVNDYECDMFGCNFFENTRPNCYCKLFDVDLDGNERCEECLNAEQI